MPEPRRDRLGTPVDEQPDGPLSGMFYRYTLELNAALIHAAHEGHSVDPEAVLDSYDRNLHPWMHGRRPHDLAERYGDQLEALGFAIGVCLGALIYGPGRVYGYLRRRWWPW